MSFQLYFTITTESGLNSLKVIFTKQFLTKVTIFRCLDVCSVRPPQIFQVQAKNIHSTDRVSRLSFRFLWLCSLSLL